MRELNEDRLIENITKRAYEDIRQHNAGGISVAVSQNDRIIFKGHFGAEPFVVTDDTLFRLASMTKPVTAVAIMMLCECGDIDLDDPIAKYLPAFQNLPVEKFQEGVLKSAFIPEIKPTIRHLLTHSSGLLGGEVGRYYLDKMTASDKATLDASVTFYAQTAMSFVPGTRQEYCGVAAFDLLGKIVEVVTQRPFDEYVTEKILKPLEMYDTTFTPTQEQWGRLIPMHRKANGQNALVGMPIGCVFEDYPAAHHLGGAGLVSSLDDYMKFATMLLNNGAYKGKCILQTASIMEMATPQLSEAVQPGTERWGLGMRVIADEAYQRLPAGAYGWSGAYGTHFWIDPVNKIAAVYMRNSKDAGGSGAATAANFEQDVCNSLQ